MFQSLQCWYAVVFAATADKVSRFGHGLPAYMGTPTSTLCVPVMACLHCVKAQTDRHTHTYAHAHT